MNTGPDAPCSNDGADRLQHDGSACPGHELKPSVTIPFMEVPARLGWSMRFGEITFWPDAPSVSFSLTPIFPGCSTQLADLGIVWDLWRLMESVRCPGAYSILNCECGYPDDAYLTESVCVSHPNDETIIWEIDFKGLRPAVDEALGHLDGFMRLIFERDTYEADVRAMLREVQRVASTPVPIADLSNLRHYAALEKEYPGCRHLLAEVFEPTVHGDCDAEEFLELDADTLWPVTPIFAPNTLLEIGYFGQHLFRVDGRTSHDWIGHWFTRWEALAAYKTWVAAITRRFALKSGLGNPNDFVLKPVHDAESSHLAGEMFAESLQRCLTEGRTAPCVQVRYVRCDIASS